MSKEAEAFASFLQDQNIAFVEELSIDGAAQFTILFASGDSPRRVFSVAFRSSGVFLLGFGGLYRFDTNADVEDIVAKLACDHSLESRDAKIPEQIPVHAYLLSRWLDEGRDREKRAVAAGGWLLISREDNLLNWHALSALLRFRPSVDPSDWPSITEPPPFATWATTSCRDTYSRDRYGFTQIEISSRKALLSAFVAAGNRLDELMALQCNRAGYTFVPSQILDRGDLESWPIPVIPIHNYSFFVTKDMSRGVFCHPWEPSVCVFGVGLVGAAMETPLPCFDEILRSSPEP